MESRNVLGIYTWNIRGVSDGDGDFHMSWLLRDERAMRRHRPSAQHHDPPLGWEPFDTHDKELRDKRVQLMCECGGCGWTLEGEWEPCQLHHDAKEPKCSK